MRYTPFKKYTKQPGPAGQLLVLLILLGSSVILKAQNTTGINWNRMTDKDYIARFVKVKYDSVSSTPFVSKILELDSAKVFSKREAQLIRLLLTDTTCYNTDSVPDRSVHFFPYAIVMTRHETYAGIIYLNKTMDIWALDPPGLFPDTIYLNKKGIVLKDSIMYEIKPRKK
ncbi:MAG: hypothetical protein JST26_13215 [Bacteroidetes bacterium]|nr:hypothetical protein [Bacteroidota bacterium]